jgi:hypothetical protein
MNKLHENDYVLVHKSNNQMVRFHLHGSVIIYGSKAEALADCNDNQLVVRCTELPIELQVELLSGTTPPAFEF